MTAKTEITPPTHTRVGGLKRLEGYVGFCYSRTILGDEIPLNAFRVSTISLASSAIFR